MKRWIFVVFIMSTTVIYGQHFKLTHATIRSWTSQSNTNQRGAEYRISLTAITKVKELTISKVWISDKCYLIESLVVDNKKSTSKNILIAKGADVKIYINVKEVLQENGVWVLNNDNCTGAPKDNQNKLKIEYSVKGKPCEMTIQDIEPLSPIQFD